jgi:hypothetical protein
MKLKLRKNRPFVDVGMTKQRTYGFRLSFKCEKSNHEIMPANKLLPCFRIKIITRNYTVIELAMKFNTYDCAAIRQSE